MAYHQDDWPTWGKYDPLISNPQYQQVTDEHGKLGNIRLPADIIRVRCAQDHNQYTFVMFTPSHPGLPRVQQQIGMDFARDPHEMGRLFCSRYLHFVLQGMTLPANTYFDFTEIWMCFSSQNHRPFAQNSRLAQLADLSDQYQNAKIATRGVLDESFIAQVAREEAETKKKLELENQFEVNMMECLIGWKGWNLSPEGLLISPSYGYQAWQPQEGFRATCAQCTPVVMTNHTCGIYAADTFEKARPHGKLRGTVYGWGRYIRGSEGWRAEFAYPKEFHLEAGQVDMIEPLKKYHVPIFIQSPIKIYSPEEDGYGHGDDQADGNSGTDQASDTSEA